MSFSESVTELLNGPQGALLLRTLRAVFFGALGFGALLALIAPGSGRPSRSSSATLKLLCLAAFAAVFVCQLSWQLAGFRNADFMRFMRRYNRRPSAASIQVVRGPILDRTGRVLAAPVPGDVWGRRSPLGAAAVHPVGYYHGTYGLTGVERVMDAPLAGFGVDTPDQRTKLGRNLLDNRAVEGAAVTLTLDARLQERAYALLDGAQGAVVALDPRTGALLALVSSPGFDPVDPAVALRDTVDRPAFNRALQGLYPPGSTLKILMAATACDAGLAPVFSCPGDGFVPAANTKPIRDSEYYGAERAGGVWGGWGRIGLRDALVHSSNVYFAQLGLRLGPDRFLETAGLLRLNGSLTILASGEASMASAEGRLPELVGRSRQMAYVGMGQGGVLLTPLHVACMTAAIANGGAWVPPRLQASAAPEPEVRVFKKASAQATAAMMRDVVLHGTGRGANVPGLSVCGKTGTAQADGGADHAWFTCFAPQKRPRLVVTVLVERGGFGAAAAVPVARALLEEAAEMGLLGDGGTKP